MAVTFEVPGTPQPQGSHSAYLRSGRIVVVDGNPKLAAWRASVTAHASSVRIGRPLAGAVAVELLFTLVRPKGSKRPAPSVRPDLDKLVRGVLDGITDAGLWSDDGQVVRLTAEEQYGPTPGCAVVLYEINERELLMRRPDDWTMPPPMFGLEEVHA